jgi:hypothetical protein
MINSRSNADVTLVPGSYTNGWRDGRESLLDELLQVVFELPSTQPERKTGHWIYGEDNGQDGWYCSECNGFVPWDYEYYGLENIDFIDDFKVCPFCEADMISRTGADMRGEQE